MFTWNWSHSIACSLPWWTEKWWCYNNFTLVSAIDRRRSSETGVSLGCVHIGGDQLFLLCFFLIITNFQ